MHKLLKPFLAALIALIASVGVIACGDDDDDDGGGGGGGGTGGELTVATVGPDNADPVMFQTTQAVQVFQLGYIALLTYAHEPGTDAGSKLIPGLAEALPEESNGGKTYKFKLREGLKYSDGTDVKASDFENTMKRLLKLGSPWSSFYTPIKGAEEFTAKADMAGDISGIETDDKTGEITITLVEPDTKILFALAEPYASPTPAAKSPGKQLKQPPPGTGPYTIDVVDFSRQWELKRNPNFNDIPGVPAGDFDEIHVQVQDNVTKMTQDVINGKADFMTEDPVGDLLPEVRQKYSDRYIEKANPPNVYYNFLNSTKPPFDKQEAREAFNYAVDSNALVRVFGGRLTPGCNFLPEGLVGYKELECKYGDPNEPGDIEKAKELVEKSGYKGETVTFFTNNKDPRPAIADYFRDVLEEIGFKAEIKTLDQQVYFEKIGQEATGAQTGFTDWFQDYPHPGDFIEVLLSGRALESEVTFNQGFVDDPVLNKKLDELRGEDPEDVADQWAELDNYVVNEKAYVLPYGSEESSSFFSERMDAESCNGIHPVYKNDWLQFCVK